MFLDVGPHLFDDLAPRGLFTADDGLEFGRQLLELVEDTAFTTAAASARALSGLLFRPVRVPVVGVSRPSE